ncbi:MAG: hypothetical protein V2A54_09970 [Bacteroidota bacterium]
MLRNLKKIILFSVFLSIAVPVFSQGDKVPKNGPALANKDFRESYIMALDYYSYEYYLDAMPIFLRLLAQERNNCNINFYVGMCMLNIVGKEKTKAIPYFEKASKKVDPNYSGNYKETAAPVHAFYYLAETYLYNYQIDEAITNYKKFESYLVGKAADENKKADVLRQIDKCNLAKELIAKPINVTITAIPLANSSFSDYAPVASFDGKTVYFNTKRRGVTGGEKDYSGEYNSDIFFSAMKGEKWQKPKKLSGKINTKAAEGISYLSPDGKYMMFYRYSKKSADIFAVETGKKGKWGAPYKLGPNINSKYDETSAYLNVEANKLLFVSDRPGGYGGKDIYVSEKLSNGEWGPPLNLGPGINTQFDEDSPFFDKDDRTLYFSSEGHKTMGGFDIFISTASDDGYWSEPENIGYPINTPFDDIYFKPTFNEKRAYYSTAKKGGFSDWDVYSITFNK